jgi:hypothetical protein
MKISVQASLTCVQMSDLHFLQLFLKKQGCVSSLMYLWHGSEVTDFSYLLSTIDLCTRLPHSVAFDQIGSY